MILLAGGRGSRMGSDIPKQYMEVAGKPLLWYCLNAVQDSAVIDDCILVCPASDNSFIREKILDKYGFDKVISVAPAGSERWESVRNGLKVLDEICCGCESGSSGGKHYVFIQDSARIFLNEDIITGCLDGVRKYGAVLAAVPCKDTIKIVDEESAICDTPPRSRVWLAQTPQVFERKLITECYDKADSSFEITDDAGVVELFSDHKVYPVMGDYQNIKVTTPEDIAVCERFLDR
ncbi:MAG: 2-C-methyl-D-erythritol 4-phosphate cytidylyltransferase [Lachnospiraceae bacterium]|nr:2-C-methyl-D-erythritol 4-phosphate cytidylyltransferase [Lachnospiraceae bacterium]